MSRYFCKKCFLHFFLYIINFSKTVIGVVWINLLFCGLQCRNLSNLLTSYKTISFGSSYFISSEDMFSKTVLVLRENLCLCLIIKQTHFNFLHITEFFRFLLLFTFQILLLELLTMHFIFYQKHVLF